MRKRRIISFLTALAFCLSLLPTAALAVSSGVIICGVPMEDGWYTVTDGVPQETDTQPDDACLEYRDGTLIIHGEVTLTKDYDTITLSVSDESLIITGGDGDSLTLTGEKAFVIESSGSAQLSGGVDFNITTANPASPFTTANDYSGDITITGTSKAPAILGNVDIASAGNVTLISSDHMAVSGTLTVEKASNIEVSGGGNAPAIMGEVNIASAGNINLRSNNGTVVSGALNIGTADSVALASNGSPVIDGSLTVKNVASNVEVSGGGSSPAIWGSANITASGDVCLISESLVVSGKLTINDASDVVISGGDGPAISGDADITASGNVRLTSNNMVASNLIVRAASNVEVSSSSTSTPTITQNADITASGSVKLISKDSIAVSGILNIRDASSVEVSNGNGGPAITSDATISTSGSVKLKSDSHIVVNGTLTVVKSSSVEVSGSSGYPTITGSANITSTGDVTLTSDDHFVVVGNLSVDSGGNVSISGGSESDSPALSKYSTISITADGSINIKDKYTGSYAPDYNSADLYSKTGQVSVKDVVYVAQLEANDKIVAYPTVEAALSAAANLTPTVSTITLIGDVTGTDYLKVSIPCILDLNGHSIRLEPQGYNQCHLWVQSGGNLTVQDTSSEQSGRIEGTPYGISVGSDATLTLTGGTFSGEYGADVAGTLIVSDKATLVGEIFGLRVSDTVQSVQLSDGIFTGGEGAIYIIRGSSNTLKDFLDTSKQTDGIYYSYYEGSTLITGILDKTAIDKTSVTVGECSHVEGYIHENGAHTPTCPACGKAETPEKCSFSFQEGENVGTCVCGSTLTVAIADTNGLIYSGQPHTPSVTATIDEGRDSAKTLVQDTDYTVEYENNTNAGENTASVTVTCKNFNGTYSKQFSIGKAQPTIAWSADKQTQALTYSGTIATITAPEIQLVNNETFNGNITYSYTKDDTNYTTLPANAGTYTITANIAETENYLSAQTTLPLTLIINKADAVVTAPPASKTLAYNGTAQALVTGGTANFGTVVYSLSQNGHYTEDIPTGINAGDYSVWYKVEDNANYNGTAPVEVDTTIEKATFTPQTGLLNVRNGYAKDYSFDLDRLLSGLAIGQDAAYTLKEINFTENGYYASNTASIHGTTLTLPIQAVTSEDLGQIGTVTVTITSQNLEDADAVINVSRVNRDPVVINGVIPQDSVYDGQPHTGFTGTPVSGNPSYTGGFEITYTGRNSTVYNSENAPANAGDYTVTVAVPGDDPEFVGSVRRNFTIEKAAVTITVASQTVLVGQPVPTPNQNGYTVSGLIGNDRLAAEPTISYASVPDMTQAGTVAIIASGAAVPATGNYQDVITYVNGTLTITAKTPVEITGVAAQDGTYSGTAQQGYTGTPTTDYSGQLEVTYLGRGNTYYTGHNAPKDAGDYSVTIAVPESDPEFTGSITLDFSIAKKPLSWDTSELTASKPAGADREATVYGILKLSGVLGEEVTLTQPKTMKTTGFDATTVGTYTVSVVPESGAWSFTPADPANYLLPEDNPAISATVNPVNETPVKPPELPEDTEDQKTKVEVESGISDIPDTLKEMYSTPAELETELSVMIREAASAVPQKNIAVYDVQLLVKINGYPWQQATAANFPENGLTITLPYPDGTNRNYHFTVVHMFTSDFGGKTPGDVETFGPADITNTADGIQFTVTGLSPIAVGWTAPNTPNTPNSGGSSHVKRDPNRNKKPSVSDSGTKEDEKAPAETGHEQNCPSRAFPDLNIGEWYHEAVDFVLDQGLMSGTNAGFAPNATLSRAMLAQILWNHAGKPSAAARSAFPDVPATEWYTNAVDWAVEKNIVSGYSDGRFAPNDSVTREQFAVMLWRYAGSPAASGELLFTDSGDAGKYALDALRWAVANGILSGKSGNRLDPTGFATRAEAAQILYNYLK